jgi:uncharacterized protein (TIGR03083 family)
MAETLASLAPDQLTQPSLCTGWSVQATARHILVGAEQTTGSFMKGMLSNGFCFNSMMDRGARRTGGLPPVEIIERLQATTTTTNRPPAPVMAMLGEIVVHGEDIRRPLGLEDAPDPEALAGCLEMYSKAKPDGGSLNLLVLFGRCEVGRKRPSFGHVDVRNRWLSDQGQRKLTSPDR